MNVEINYRSPTLTPWEMMLAITTDQNGDDGHVVVYNVHGYGEKNFSGAAPEIGRPIPFWEEAPKPPTGYDPETCTYDYFVGHSASTWRENDGSAGVFYPAWVGTTVLSSVVAALNRGCRVWMTMPTESSRVEKIWEGIELFELLAWHLKNVRAFQDSEQGNWCALSSNEGRELYQEYLMAGGEVEPCHGVRCYGASPAEFSATARWLLQSL